ncbi:MULTISPECIES: hypothetical protein [unclassified Pseudofrankia]|uniref:hypothetical protein n=1 Tax=unclassified Pseudofrankia TaxID=2994372 RepID=UPI001041F18C|nr:MULTISPECIES: hypothetical protein [unclassified Pseudofrankia]MDT3440128.1 hypothetical protein [Pseudofrankia sp. BMG5.37]
MRRCPRASLTRGIRTVLAYHVIFRADRAALTDASSTRRSRSSCRMTWIKPSFHPDSDRRVSAVLAYLRRAAN